MIQDQIRQIDKLQRWGQSICFVSFCIFQAERNGMAKHSLDFGELHGEARFQAYVDLVGDLEKAFYRLNKFWSTALRYWGDGRKGVPAQVFALDPYWQHLIVVGFADVAEDGSILARGHKKQFDWLAKKRAAASAGGRASAASREESTGSSQPHGARSMPEAPPKHARSTAEAPPKQDRSTEQANSNPSISSSISTSASSEAEREERAKALSHPEPGPRARARKEPLKPTFSEADLETATLWLADALKEMPWKQGHAQWTPEHFAAALAKIRRATDLNDEGLRRLQRFIAEDEFWRDKACSPSGLLNRSSRNGERKIDNILVRMRTKSDRVGEGLLKWAQEGS